jgi:phage FluMu protein Com
MKPSGHEFWLCQDCVQVAVNGDYSGIDYYAKNEAEASDIVHRIDKGLAALGPNLVPDFWDSSEPRYRCEDCDHEFDLADAQRVEDEDGYICIACPECKSLDTNERDYGEEEFSYRECDCCGEDLAGYRFRFTTLIP